MFAVTHAGVEPDVLCMAKGIASGFPFSAIGAARRAHGPLAHRAATAARTVATRSGCAAALATIDVLTEPGFLENVRARASSSRAGLTELAASDPRHRPGARAGLDGRD